MTTISETPEAFRNPMKGFRPSRFLQETGFRDHEYASVYKHYIRYQDLESQADDSVEKIREWSDEQWAELAARNLKVIPRVVLLYPGEGEFWGDIPHDGTPQQWVSEDLKARLRPFVEKLGQAWDDDPRVAAVEMGLWGKWGEHHIYPDVVDGNDRIPVSIQEILGDAFSAAFKNKKVMVRYPTTFVDRDDFGFLWDSFALPDDDNEGGGAGIIARDLWRTQMQSGEVAYDWGDQSNLGGSPDQTLLSAERTDYVIDYIRRVHTSSLGWISDYTPDDDAISTNAARMQKELGYRFVITRARFDERLDASGEFGLSLELENRGNAPFYYPWPLEVSLLDSTRAVVWKAVWDGVDITDWLPGESVAISDRFQPSVPSGSYTVCVAILDPAGNRPSVRFANANYYQGGRTPLGRIGAGETPDTQDVSPFDSLKADSSLTYDAP